MAMTKRATLVDEVASEFKISMTGSAGLRLMSEGALEALQRDLRTYVARERQTAVAAALDEAALCGACGERFAPDEVAGAERCPSCGESRRHGA